MSSRKIDQIKGKFSRKRIFLSVTLSFIVIFSSGVFWDNAEAVVLESGPKLTKVGPTSGGNGFPVWYKDSNGTRLELCLDVGDPYCELFQKISIRSLPISFLIITQEKPFTNSLVPKWKLQGKEVPLPLSLLKLHLTEGTYCRRPNRIWTYPLSI